MCLRLWGGAAGAQIVKKVGGTVDDTELIEGLVFTQKASKKAGGPSQIANAKIALLQFCISPPKTDVRCKVATCGCCHHHRPQCSVAAHARRV